MIRGLMSLLSVLCMAVVLCEAGGAGYFWFTGRLSRETLHEMGDVLVGKPPEPPADDDAEPKPVPTVDEVMQARVGRLFDLGTREQELLLLKTMIVQQAEQVTALRGELEKDRKSFAEELKTLKERNEEDAVQQSRAVLQALQPADAAAAVMSLSPEQSLRVVRGLPEKTIARILKELTRGDDKMKERGDKLLQSITEGEPSRKLIDDATAQLSTGNPG